MKNYILYKNISFLILKRKYVLSTFFACLVSSVLDRSFFVLSSKSIKDVYLKAGFTLLLCENLKAKLANKIKSRFSIKICIEKNINTISTFMNIKTSSCFIGFLRLFEPTPTKELFPISETKVFIELIFNINLDIAKVHLPGQISFGGNCGTWGRKGTV